MKVQPLVIVSKFLKGCKKFGILSLYICLLCFSTELAFSQKKEAPKEIQQKKDNRSKKDDDKKGKGKKGKDKDKDKDKKDKDKKDKKDKDKKDKDKKDKDKKDKDKKDKKDKLPKIKVFVCHEGETKEIYERDLQKHLNHGDAAGPCEDPIDFNGSITPYLPPVGKVEEKIGPELTALFEIFEQTQNAASNEIFTVSNGNLVLIDIEAEPSRTNAVISFLADNYNITEFVVNELSENNQLNKELITVLFPIDKLKELQLNDDIESYGPVLPPITNSGVALSQGDVAQQSDKARKVFELNGEGIKIGVLSDSYNALGLDAASSDVRIGELPGVENPDFIIPVKVILDYPSVLGSRFISSDEGRAMLQIIHDVAPGAELFFRTGVISAGDMAEGIFELQREGCDIIIDDITHYTEPFFKDGPIANAVDIVTSQGVDYFTSAGNFGNNSYEAQFNPATTSENNHDFNLGTDQDEVDIMQKIHFSTGFGRIVLQWDDDFGSLNENDGAKVDLDIYIINDEGDTLVNSNRNNIGGDPFEMMAFNVKDGFAQANIVIHRASGTENVNFKYIVFEGQDFKIEEHGAGASTITGHANALGAFTVGAVLYKNTPAFDTIPSIASFSSRGGTVVNGTPRNKPDISAPNGVNTTVHLGTIINDDGTIFNIDGDDYPNFFGTSASAPHAAASAALTQSAFNKFGVDGNVKELLQETAVDMGIAGFDLASGAGFIQSDLAIMTFAAPIPTIKELIVPEGIIPGTQVFDVTIRGEYLSDDTRVLFDGDTIPEEDMGFIDAAHITATIPEFSEEADPPLFAINNAITPNGNDGGTSEPLYFYRPPKKIITITADDKTKKYGEKLPEFTATILIDDIPLDSTGITTDSLGLSNLIYSTSANSLSDVGFGYIRTKILAHEFDSAFLDYYEYKFFQGTIKIEKLPITIIPNDLIKTYGDKIDSITYRYNFDSTNVDVANIQLFLDSLELSYKSTFPGEDSIAIINKSRFLLNKSRFLLNGSAWAATNFGLINKSRFLLNGNVVIEIDTILLNDYQDHPEGTISNKSRFLLNGESFARGEGYNVDKSRFLLNDGALVNSDDSPEGFSDIIIVANEQDSLVNTLYSINLISGLEVTRDSLHYIIPGAFLSPEAENFEITYGVGKLEILPANLAVTVDDKIIINGDSLPEFTSAISGYAYEENDTTVFSNISYSPIAYEGAGTYPIIPTLVFADEENYVFDPDPIVPGTLKVVDYNGQIAFAHVNELSNLEIELVNTDGSDPVSVVTGSESIRDPQFAPNKAEIVFTLAPSTGTGAVFNAANGHYYELVESGVISWTAANAAANAATPTIAMPTNYIGHLVTITDQAENDFVGSLSDGDFRPWIGLTDATVEGTFQWVTGELFVYSNWETGEPNNMFGGEDHVEFFGHNHKWNDVVNSHPLTSSYVIEYESAPLPNTPSLPNLGAPQDQSLWKVNVDGSGLTELTSGTNNHSSSFSPDGLKIAFIKNNEIAIMNADGSGTSILTSSLTSKRWTTFSPDGQDIFYVQSVADIYTDSFNSLWKVNINTLITEQISPANSTLFYRSPVFLKDGSKIIYVRHDKVGQAPRAIMSMNPDGSGQTALLINDFITNDVDVSPDNAKLVFSLQDSVSADYTLHTMDIEDGNIEEIYRKSNLVLWPSWGTNPEALDLLYVNIPDPNFEQTLIDLGIDSDGIINQQIRKTDALAVEDLYIAHSEENKKISDLTGIEAFANMWRLECQFNQLTSLDVSQNTALTHLFCGGNQLKKLDVSQNTNLIVLSCYENQLTSLDLSNNTALTRLICQENSITSLDVTQNTALESLRCAGNELSSLDVSQNNLLWQLVCEGNHLTSLDLSQNTSLTEIDTRFNNLVNLDVRNGNNSNVTSFKASTNSLSCISVDDAGALYLEAWNIDPGALFNDNCEEFVYIPDAYFEQALIDLGIDSDGIINQQMLRSEAEAVTELNVSDPLNNSSLPNVNGEIANLTGIEAFVNLGILKCQNNSLTSLDVTQSAALIDLDCSNNQLSNLNISQNTLLSFLWCNENELTELDVSHNTALTNLNFQGNQVSSINLSQNTALTSLYCAFNQLETLDVSHNTALVDLSCPHNLLTSLDVFNNTALISLQCGSNLLKVLELSNNTSLTGLFCDFNRLEILYVSDNTALTALSFYNNLITSLDLYQNKSLQVLNSGLNPLTKLDVSQNTVLNILVCSYDQLTSLDVSQNTALTELLIDNNQLTSLDLRNGNNDNITVFDAGNNKLTCISVDDESSNHSTWTVDAGVSFSNDCDLPVYIPNENFEQALIDLGIDSDGIINEQILTSDALAVSSLDVSDPENNGSLPNVNAKISDLTGIEAFANLTHLYCQFNQLTNLDLSQNIALVQLYSYNNQITALDFSQNIALADLLCYENKLTSLNISKNIALTHLNCYGNKLTSLDVSQNIALTGLSYPSVYPIFQYWMNYVKLAP